MWMWFSRSLVFSERKRDGFEKEVKSCHEEAAGE